MSSGPIELIRQSDERITETTVDESRDTLDAGAQSLADCPYRDDRHLHGGSRYERRHCRSPSYRWRLGGEPGWEQLGSDVLPCFQRHRSATERLALLDLWQAALLHELRRVVYVELISLRYCA